MASYFNSKISSLGNSRERQFGTSKLCWNIGWSVNRGEGLRLCRKERAWGGLLWFFIGCRQVGSCLFFFFLWWDLQVVVWCVGEGNGTPLQYSCLENSMDGGAWKAAVHGVAEGQTRLSDFTFTFHFQALEKEMATHSSVLAWRIPGTGEPGGLLSMGSHRVGHDWSDLAVAVAVWCVGELPLEHYMVPFYFFKLKYDCFMMLC